MTPPTKQIAISIASLLVSAHASFAWAQASCSSDGAPQPVTVFERFVNADCETCWSDAVTPAPSARAGAVVLDWIVPAASGDQAPLSAAATNDAIVRLEAIGRTVPATSDVHVTPLERTAATAGKLRVAHGMPFNDYIGTAISWVPAGHTKVQARLHAANTYPLTYHLLLVESVPAGTDGTAVPRQIVRNLLQGSWTSGDLRPHAKTRPQWVETRSMRIPEGAQAERLSMVGWVSDAQGRTIAATQSVCR